VIVFDRYVIDFGYFNDMLKYPFLCKNKHMDKYYEDGEWWEDIPIIIDYRDILKFLEGENVPESLYKSIPANTTIWNDSSTEDGANAAAISPTGAATAHWSKCKLDICNRGTRGKGAYCTAQSNNLDDGQ
jgi:hypothetical protein